MIRERKPFLPVSYTESAAYEAPFQGYPVSAIQLSLRGIAGTAAATPAADAVARQLGTDFAIRQDQRDVIRVPGGSWRHLCALQGGRYGLHSAGAAGAAMIFDSHLDLEQLYPGCLIDASSGGSRAVIGGTWASFAQYSATPPTGAHTNVLAARAHRSQRNPAAGYWRPYIRPFEVDLSVAGTDVSKTIPFDQDQVFFGMMIETVDNSDGTGGSNRDGLVKRFSANANISGQQANIEFEGGARWSNLRAETIRAAGFDAVDINQSVGVVFIDIDDPADPNIEKGILVRAGDSLSLHFDTLTTAEDGYTSLTPAAGDKARVLLLSVERVEAVLGEPNAGIQRRISTPQLDRTPRRTVRRRTRRRRLRA